MLITISLVGETEEEIFEYLGWNYKTLQERK